MELTDIVKASLLALIPIHVIVHGCTYFLLLLVVNVIVYGACVACRQGKKLNMLRLAATVTVATMLSWFIGTAMSVVAHDVSGALWGGGISIVICVIACFSSDNPVATVISTVKELLLAWKGVDSNGKNN